MTIGRDSSNTVLIDDDEVSRFHLRIKKRGRLFILEDLESRNGTYLNGDRILNSIVQNGDKILIGSTEFTFLTSESDIHLATTIMQFDMIVADELGLKGPIDIGSPYVEQGFTPIRLNMTNIANQHEHDAKAIRDIYELHSNILVAAELEEASSTLLKGIGQLVPRAHRAAIFAWAASSRQLLPISTRQYKRKKDSFLISRRSLEDVLARKQGVLLQPEAPNVTQSGRHRAILPILHHGETIAILHMECDDPRRGFEARELEFAQALLARCGPSFETMMLRRELDAWMFGMIETMIATIEAKDTYTHGHSERVSKYCMAIADELKLNKDVKRHLLVSALCHDIGKIGIPDAILKKASMLSSEEYEEMKLHPSIGSQIVSHMPNANRFVSGVKYHHEKWDGSGYPEGLAGEDIPFFGRIVGIADVFDAMVSGRAYSGFMDQTDAIEKLVDEKELFDPEILKACVKAYESGRLSLKTSTANNKPDGETRGDKPGSPPATAVQVPLKAEKLPPSKKRKP